VYPKDRKRARRRQANELVLSREDVDAISEVPEVLVPVRLDFDVDKYRLRDTFTWNLNEKHISIEQFTENLVEDFGIPLAESAQIISKSIREQVTDFQPHGFVDENADSRYIDEDMRILVKLDITIGQHNLVDQFEWDMNCSQNSPEKFAEIMCNELSLSGEFVTAIAHAIREQTQFFTKSLIIVGHPFDGRPVEDDDIRREICPTVEDIVRPKTIIKDFSPVLFEIPEAELDRQDKDRERDSRRKRRQGRAGRRIQLPDLKEVVRTFRTPVYASILPGGIDKNLELLRKQVRKKLAAQEDSDGDEDSAAPSYPTHHHRRGRIPHHAQQAGFVHHRSP
jgi:SWI/SNF-related matrix-associated actin-dependent regulator of chromatin subfamily B protein 1